MDNRDLLYLPESNAGFEAWIRRHPTGFVVNAIRTGAQAMVWHQATCHHLQPDGQSHWVDGEYIKACSLHPGVLAEWISERKEEVHYCSDCRDLWSKGHS
jgi:hypothetical protein